MAKADIVEDTKSQHASNVDAKVNKMDKPKKLEGEIDVVNKKPHLNATDKLPDYSAATSKDKSKSSKVSKGVGAGEQQGTMNNMPMVKKLDEEDETEGDELTEEEAAALDELRAGVMENLIDRLADYIPDPDVAIDMSEHVNVMFEGTEGLTEEFKDKARTIFEAAVSSEVNTKLLSILEAATDAIIESEISITEEYDSKIENALTAIGEAWLETNQVGIQSQLKTEITEDFIHGLVNLMQEHNIMLPEDKVDVVEAMADKVMELEAQLNEQIETNINLKICLDEEIKKSKVDELAEGLTDTQAAKFKTLCEGVDGDNFVEKVTQIKESYFGTPKNKPKLGKGIDTEGRVLTEAEVIAEAQEMTNPVKPEAPMAAALSRFAPRR